jgi:hypothetical protein
MKMNTARSFAARVYNLSEWRYRVENTRTIREILEKNNYPPNLTSKIIKHALHTHRQKHYRTNKDRATIHTNKNNSNYNNNAADNNPHITITHNNSNITEYSNNESNIVTLEGSKRIHRSLTYVPQLSENISKKIRKANNTIQIAYRTNNQMRQHYSKLKDKTSKEDLSSVIYKVECNDCDKSYIGQTGQKLKKRLQQHEYYIRSKSPLSGLATHAIEESHTFNFIEAKILDTETNRKKRETKETINIYKNRSRSVNIKQDLNNFRRVYTPIIKTP